MNSITSAVVAEKINGQLFGSDTVSLTAIKPLEYAGPTDLSFFAPNSKKNSSDLLKIAQSSKAGALLVSNFDKTISTTQIVIPEPMKAVIALARIFSPEIRPASGIHPTAVVPQSAEIGNNVSIGAFSVIGENVVLGEDCIIHPHVVIYNNAKIGKKSVIHSGAVIREHVTLGEDCLVQNGVVIGGDGFGYYPDPKVGLNRIPHIGTVVIEDRVDFGANATVDRATIGETKIGSGTKIDNLVMVGHNNKIGKNNIFCSQVGLSGSCTVGDNVILGGKVGMADHLSIGSNVKVAAKSGITNNLESNAVYAGFPAVPAIKWRRKEASMSRLENLFKKVRHIERSLTELAEKFGDKK